MCTYPPHEYVFMFYMKTYRVLFIEKLNGPVALYSAITKQKFFLFFRLLPLGSRHSVCVCLYNKENDAAKKKKRVSVYNMLDEPRSLISLGTRASTWTLLQPFFQHNYFSFDHQNVTQYCFHTLW